MNNKSGNKIDVSIIIPAKNEEKALPKCLNSINKYICKLTNAEIIIVDNGSSDRTVEVSQNFSAKIFVRPNDNLSKLRNFGAEKALGEYFLFIDADVEIKENFLQNSMRHFQNSKVGIVTGLILIPEKATWVEKTWYMKRVKTEKIKEVQWSSSMNMIITRRVFFEVGGFSENFITCEDVDFSQKVIKAGYKILYDYDVQVVHFGEAKTVKEFFKKERWRGYSSLTLAMKYISNYNRMLSFLQVPFFFISFTLFILSLFFYNYEISGLFLFLFLFLPLNKSVTISYKNKTAKYFPRLFIIWFIYYVAKVLAIFDERVIKKVYR
jgi:GT2 family glycosyltransferase